MKFIINLVDTKMNLKWRNTVVIISVVLLLILPPFSQASPSPRRNETNTLAKESYMTDWHVHNSNAPLAAPEPYAGLYAGSTAENMFADTTKSSGGPMNSPWPMLSHDGFHSGRSQYSTANNTGTELWQIYGGEIWSSAVIDKNGTIYFGTLGSDYHFYAIYPNGKIKWKFQTSDQIWSTPAIAEDGTIYTGTWGGYFTAIWPNGKQKWLFDESFSYSPAIAPDGTIYFGSDHNEKGPVYALNPNGTLKWVYITNFTVLGCPAIGSDGTIYIGSGDNYLYALNPNGTLRWRYQTGDYIKGSASIAPGGTIYVPSFDGYLYALNPNGTLYWRAWTGGSIAAAGVALGADGTIYVGTEKLRASIQTAP